MYMIRGASAARGLRSVLAGRTVQRSLASAPAHTQPKLSASELQGYKDYYKSLQDTVGSLPEEVASASVPLAALHSRLQLPESFTKSMLSRCLTCRSAQLPPLALAPGEAASGGSGSLSSLRAFPSTVQTNKLLDNHGLNILGKNVLAFHATNFLLHKYPRLPTVVLNAAIDSYIGQDTLALVGRSWGIEREETPVIERYLRSEPLGVTLGKLRYFNNSLERLDGIERISRANFSESSALALAVRSVVGVLYAIDPKLAHDFISKHITSRKLDVAKMFAFEQPTRELARLCLREGLQSPVSKLTAESGRLSKAPVFIVGVFSGEEQLGEGFGASLKEAKARAATDALLKWYCYQPALKQGQKPLIDHGTVIV